MKINAHFIRYKGAEILVIFEYKSINDKYHFYRSSKHTVHNAITSIYYIYNCKITLYKTN